MSKMSLDDFIKYASEQFGCEISVKPCDDPDTFESVFGTSFLDGESYEGTIDGFDNELSYENTSIAVRFCSEVGMSGVIYSSDIGLAA